MVICKMISNHPFIHLWKYKVPFILIPDTNSYSRVMQDFEVLFSEGYYQGNTPAARCFIP